MNGKYVYFAVPMEALGLGAKTGNVNDKIYFKVADSVENPADIMDYYVSGRSLPEGRLSYEYVFTY